MNEVNNDEGLKKRALAKKIDKHISHLITLTIFLPVFLVSLVGTDSISKDKNTIAFALLVALLVMVYLVFELNKKPCLWAILKH